MTKARKDKQKVAKSLKIDIEITPHYSCESRCTGCIQDNLQKPLKVIFIHSFSNSEKEIKKKKNETWIFAWKNRENATLLYCFEF